MRVSQMIFAGVLGVFLMSAAVQAEEVDNPQFKAWTKFDVGASATLNGTMTSQNGMAMTIETTRKLVEKADDHVTLEISSTVTVMGQPHAGPSQKVTIPAKIEKRDITDDGKEDVKAAGKTYSCQVFEAIGADPKHPDAKAKMWVSDEVPGGVVKMEVKTGQADVTFLLASSTTK